MLLHAWIDFTTFAFADASADSGSPLIMLNFAQYGAYFLVLVGVVVVLRRGTRPADADQDALATA